MSFLTDNPLHLTMVSNEETPLCNYSLDEEQVYMYILKVNTQTTGLITNLGSGLDIFEMVCTAYDNGVYYVLSGSFVEYDDITGNITYTGGETLDKLCVKMKYTKV